jgi:hypothetical protein
MSDDPMRLRAADRMAAAIDLLVRRGALDARSLPADARLDYGTPWSEEEALRVYEGGDPPGADLDEARDAEELLHSGLLFELNRRVLHPLGLALAVETRGGRAERISPRLVRTDDPEGLVYSEADLEDGYGKLRAYLRVSGYARLARRYEVLGFRAQVPEDVEPNRHADEADWGPTRLRVAAKVARALLAAARLLEYMRLDGFDPAEDGLAEDDPVEELAEALRDVAADDDLEVRP